MTLNDPLTFIIITVLILAFSGQLGHNLYTIAERECYESNSVLQSDHREGPLRQC